MFKLSGNPSPLFIHARSERTPLNHPALSLLIISLLIVPFVFIVKSFINVFDITIASNIYVSIFKSPLY